MSWGEWVNSEYNSGRFIVGVQGDILTSAGRSLKDGDNFVSYFEVIVSNYQYSLTMIGYGEQ